MKITEQEVQYVASLANLRLPDEEVPRFVRDLEEILTYVEKLNELDTTGVEPMAQVLYEAEETATLAADIARPGLGSDLALANAPLAGAGHFKVPLVIEK